MTTGTQLRRFALAGGTSLTALLLAAAPAHAQDTATEAAAQTADEVAPGGEIIVTAQRRAERLQDVPIAISALGSEDLARKGVSDVEDLVGNIPGLSISGTGGINSSNVIAIRGVAGLPNPIGSGQATAIYLDGVYLPRPDAAFFALDDVERIEVLRGPQGTLYGRNATAGAINIITRTPDDVLRGGVDLSYGNYDELRIRGSLSGPLGGGFSVGVSGSYERRDGFSVNTLLNRRIDNKEAGTIRGKLHYESPGSDFDATLSGDWSAIDGVTVTRNPYNFPTGTTVIPIGAPYRVQGDQLTADQIGDRTRSDGVSLTMNVAASDNVQLTSITSYRTLKVRTAFDTDGSAVAALMSENRGRNKSFNQELRAVLDFDRFRATLGGNYFSEDAFNELGARNPALPFTANPRTISDLKAWALFGQMEFDLTEQLTLVGGLRYNSESRDFSIDYRPIGSTTFIQGKIKDEKLIPSVGVNFKATDDILVYAKASQGYQAPGFAGLPGAASTTANTFDAETLWAYEAGVKSQFLDRRVTLNVAGFYYDYKDLQVRQVIGVGVIGIQNAANATVKGFEANLSVTPIEGLTLSGQVTYSDAKYKDFCETLSAAVPQAGDPLCVTAPGALPQANRSGNRLNQAPKWSGGLSLDYRTQVADAGELSANVGYSWESNNFFSAGNESMLSTGGWSRLDARLSFTIGEDGPEIYIYGKNLTNELFVTYAQRALPNLAPVIYNDPRTYGIGVRYKF